MSRDGSHGISMVIITFHAIQGILISLCT